MGYAHIENLHRDVRILEFKWVWAMEKVHGTSSHVTWRKVTGISFFSGGESYNNFVALFDQDNLKKKFEESGVLEATIYGEAYGGKCQGMKATYGDKLKFICFEVEIDGMFLAVPQAEEFVKELGLEFVHYEKCSTELAALDVLRDADSVQAIRNGMGPGHQREGIVLRPPFEVRLNNNERLIAKYKGEKFQETQKPRKVGEAPEVIAEAQKAADDFVTVMRFQHVIDKLPEARGMEHTKMVVDAMLEDVLREGSGEFVDTPAARKAICKAAAAMWKKKVSTIILP